MSAPHVVDLAESDYEGSPVGTSAEIERSEWAGKILSSWRKSVESILEVGALLIEAKEALPHGAFQIMVKSWLPFSSRTAQRLMEISRHPVLSNRTHASVLPASWMTLYELSKMDEREVNAAITYHMLKPDLARKDVPKLREKVLRVLGGRRTRVRRGAEEVAKPNGFDRLAKAWERASQDDRDRFIDHLLANISETQLAVIADRLSERSEKGRPKNGARAPFSQKDAASLLGVSADTVKRVRAVREAGA